MNLFERPQKKLSNAEIQKEKYMAELGYDGMHIVDSMELLETTLNPSTYFYRERFASNSAVVHMKNPYPVWKGFTCKQIYEMLNERSSLNIRHREFIDRLFAAGREDSLTYKMHEVGLGLSPETRIYFLKKLNGKKYHFCVVGFPETNKKYTYVTKDKSIASGDIVAIPSGNESAPETKIKTVLDVFDASLDELDFPIERLRCVEEKLRGAGEKIREIKCPGCGASIEVDTSEKTGKCPYCQALFYLLS